MIKSVFAAPKYIALEEGMGFAKTYGLGYEIPCFSYPDALDKRAEKIAWYRQQLADLSGPRSLHGPVIDLNPVSLDVTLAEPSHVRYLQAIETALALDVKYMVLHSQFTPIYDVAGIYEMWVDQTVAYWQRVIEQHLHGTELVIVLENFLDDRPEILRDIVRRVASPHLKICLDTGHVNLFSSRPATEWLDVLAPDVVYLHVHNNHGQLDDHRAFDDGSLNMNAFLSHVQQHAHGFHVALEVFNIPGLHSSYQQLKPFLSQTSQTSLTNPADNAIFSVTNKAHIGLTAVKPANAPASQGIIEGLPSKSFIL